MAMHITLFILVAVIFERAAATTVGGWTAWTVYTACSHSCGLGYQDRWRYCTNPPPPPGTTYCVGHNHESKPCHLGACAINGAWGDWTAYQACSETCGTGQQTRYRYCNSPRPQNGGAGCPDDGFQTAPCNYGECPGHTGLVDRIMKPYANSVDGSWSRWSSFSTCSHSCGGGMQNSHRTCTNPAPANGGMRCQGNDVMNQACNTMSCPCVGSNCPVDGSWTNYTTCSRTCDVGTTTKYRYCNHPHPAHGGKDCVGDNYETHNCYITACAGSQVVDGGWGMWSDYNQCSKSCGSGTQSRYRVCDHPRPSDTGRQCVGESRQTAVCHTEACPCTGLSCPVNGRWSDWLSFSVCSHTCGTGTKIRYRYCNNPRPQNGGEYCVGSQSDVQACTEATCQGPSPVAGGWSTWVAWSTCTQSCGSATSTRYRYCNTPAPANGGTNCPGESTQTQGCNLVACPTSTCGTTVVSTTLNKIVGGTLAQHGQFPWQISLRYYNDHICGGTLISDQWVLSAAHCFEDYGTTASQWSIGVGLQDHSHASGSNVIHVSQVTMHEHYDSDSERHDIAIIKLSKKLDITGPYIRPACLPQPQDDFPSDTCMVSGWGATYYDKDGNAPVTQFLEYVALDTISNTYCKNLLGASSVFTTNICAGATHTGGKDTCQGDSGGPLVCNKHGVWELVGVTSWGDGCGKPMSPGVYTRVTSYLTWIQQHMNA